jgi:hypothetical protein
MTSRIPCAADAQHGGDCFQKFVLSMFVQQLAVSILALTSIVYVHSYIATAACPCFSLYI